MEKDIIKAIEKLNKKEEKLLQKKSNNALKDKIYAKIPDKVSGVLESAFSKAFKTVFLRGTAIIEKTMAKDDISTEFDANDYIMDKRDNKKSIKRLDKASKRTNLINNAFTTASGMGLGILGMGLPDIPLLVSTILKGVYEIALSFGFSYDSDKEKIYILRLISLAICGDSLRAECGRQLCSMATEGENLDRENLDRENLDRENLDREIQKTAKLLSDRLLVEKFLQGIPLVGVVGGFVNHDIYKKITQLSVIRYKKRYLLERLAKQ